MKLIVGLGNPGEKYNNTRHNLGFWLLDKLVEEKGLIWEENKKFKAMVAKDTDLNYLKPLTYMNLSGEAVRKYLDYYKFLPKSFFMQTKNVDLSEILTIVHDDLDIKLGEFKISINSRSAGNRGVASIINHLKTQNFKRVRIGIKSEAQGQIPAERFVVGKLSEEEQNKITALYPEIKIALN